MKGRLNTTLYASALVVLLLAACSACSTTGAGATSVRQFDKQAFNTLIVAQAALEQAKVEVQGTQYVHQFNVAVNHYNEAYKAYGIFHAAVEVGTNTNSENLRQQLVALLSEVAELRQALGNSGGPVT